ncbi:MAG: bifunctional 4-hydroxy-3-methylbut-2-enyl diphosphate reductase/30S ribosomal protein S1 [Clostridia bacterium]|nr:bifunctional 4-hydroxy-3-methylbut-2-enyl diphosphate reductase/30S ribosomal protein S1 [Clostridia bacterium]
MPLTVAEHAGFCMGVRRAVRAAEALAADGKKACTLGELIHNPVVVNRLKEAGIPPVRTVEEAQGRCVLIRSHGVAPRVLEELQRSGCEVLDLTCPFVERVHRLVRDGSADGTPVILAGEREHPETVGTAGWALADVYVISSAEEAKALPPMDRAVVCGQTTFSPAVWEEIASVLRERIPGADIHCTICPATEQRQREAAALAERSDAMIVVGGRKSANTRKLYDSCKKLCPRTILVESAAEIPPAFANIHLEEIGMTAGASTPDDSLKEVVTLMTDIENINQVTPEEPKEEAKNDFMAEVEATLQTKPRSGQVVTGTVVQVNDEEVCVNINYKSDGICKRSDLSDQDVKVGDQIEVEVIKVNDGEGNVVLSQRNIVNRKAWEALMEKYNAGEYVDGVGKEAVKGGLLADVGGVRAFVPASQLAPRYVEHIEDFVGKNMRLKVIEVNEQKKRIVASRKQVMQEETAARKKEAWDRLEEGIVIHGIVRRLTDFGAFVDVGGVDGLVHITDLSWGRIKHPNEVVKPNQEIDVKVLSLDRERERIQLGYKQLLPRPWDNAAEKYPVGAIVEGKVVRLATFGAFVELEPGLDGLVHISQCALTKIAKVEDAVQEGQIVRVKVINVDTEAKRISLSIRQVLEDEAFEADAGDFDLPAEDEAVVAISIDAPAEEAAEAAAEAAEEATEAAAEVAEVAEEAVEAAAEAAEEAAPEA